MAAPALTDDEVREIVDAWRAAGSKTGASKALGVARNRVEHGVRIARERGLIDSNWTPGSTRAIPDAETQADREDGARLRKALREAHRRINAQAEQLALLSKYDDMMRDAEIPRIKARKGRASESVAVAVASDWHIEERIDPETVDGLNRHDLAIAEARAARFFQNLDRLVKTLRDATRIRTLVLALLGDFITGYIHPELEEGNTLTPVEAMLRAFSFLVSGIDFILESTDLDRIICVTACGNHGRTTPSPRVATQNVNNHEWALYQFLARHYQKERRVQFQISKGYFNFLDIFEFTFRFHHGHAIRYAGGIGGVHIPLRKAVGQWNQQRRVYQDVLGHWHTLDFSSRYVINGSSIGHSPYATHIKADYERPQQAFFLVHPDYGRTITAPIFVEDAKP